MFYNVCSSHPGEFLFVELRSPQKRFLQIKHKETTIGYTQSVTVYQKNDEAKI